MNSSAVLPCLQFAGSLGLRQSQAGGGFVDLPSIFLHGTSQIPAGKCEITLVLLLPSSSCRAQPSHLEPRLGSRQTENKRLLVRTIKECCALCLGEIRSQSQRQQQHFAAKAPGSIHRHPQGWKRAWRSCSPHCSLPTAGDLSTAHRDCCQASAGGLNNKLHICERRVLKSERLRFGVEQSFEKNIHIYKNLQNKGKSCGSQLFCDPAQMFAPKAAWCLFCAEL